MEPPVQQSKKTYSSIRIWIDTEMPPANAGIGQSNVAKEIGANIYLVFFRFEDDAVSIILFF